ncbi:hypothetical protein CK627_21115 [Aeromonas dhakensis]|uniref:hypothetical protein n=2 Tax=Aeromonas dhakensis TaxID=196024 RepID=UPI000BAAEC08|nr:hypothetical protein [Aeromonas dhakensis]ASX13107.1 hypothetical protein CK627_21115 [Aeromonas dhakensis]
MFEIWDEAGQAKGLNLQQLQQRLTSYRGEVMVRYINRIGLPTTLFLTVDKGLAYQRFKADTPLLDWDWLAQASLTALHEATPLYPLEAISR